MEKKKTKIADVDAGSTGMPGGSFEIIEAKAFELPSGRIEVRIRATNGSNQGYLEAHDEDYLTSRGDNVLQAIEALRDDVEGWEGWLSLPERRQLLRDLEYEAEDFFSPTNQ